MLGVTLAEVDFVCGEACGAEPAFFFNQTKDYVWLAS